MNYGFKKEVTLSFDEAVARVTETLVTGGFGVLTTIDVKATMKQKLDVDFDKYIILGACNPALAHEALQLEDKVGTMLPCNLVVQQTGDGRIEVAAINPVASMQAIDNPQLKQAAAVVRDKLSKVSEALRIG